MKIKDNGYIGATGYLSLEDCILSWGEEGRKLIGGNDGVHKIVTNEKNNINFISIVIVGMFC